MEYVAMIISGSFGAAIVSLISLCLQRRWQKNDKIDAIVDAQKLTMIDQVKLSAKKYIRLGQIPLEEKEHIKEKYAAYKALGGNGHLDTIMNEIDRLKVVDK